MDKSRSHDILHTYSGGTDSACKFCQGEMTEAEMKKEATKIAAENYRPQVSKDVPYEKRLMTYDDKGNPIEKKEEDKPADKKSEPILTTFATIMDFAEKKGDLPKRIKLLSYGEINSPVYGKVIINKQIAEDMVKHFNASLRASSKDIGVPIDFEHGETALKDAAGGWIKKLFAESDGMWGETDWTSLGEKALNDKQYKCISPSFYLQGYKDPETGKEYQNVFTGAALVNKPGMPSLPPIVNKEPDKNTLLTEELKTSTIFIEIKNLPNSNMNLKEILQKETAKTELTFDEKKFALSEILKVEQSKRGSDEQKFLVGHKEELSFAEAKAEGFAMDFKEVKTEKKEEVKPGQIVMSEQDVTDLKTKAEQGEKAFKALAEMKKKTDLIEMKEKVKQAAITDKGIKLPADQIDKFAGKLVNMSEDDRKDMLDMITALPTKEIFEEKGAENAVNMSENPGLALDTLTKAKVAEAQKAGKEIKYTEAQAIVFKENPNLMKSAYAPQTN